MLSSTTALSITFRQLLDVLEGIKKEVHADVITSARVPLKSLSADYYLELRLCSLSLSLS